jgi:hypothetical protein
MSSGASANCMPTRQVGLQIVESAGIFPCDLFVDQFDPAHGQKSAFTRARLLTYRKRVGTQKFVETSEKLERALETGFLIAGKMFPT